MRLVSTPPHNLTVPVVSHLFYIYRRHKLRECIVHTNYIVTSMGSISLTIKYVPPISSERLFLSDSLELLPSLSEYTDIFRLTIDSLPL